MQETENLRPPKPRKKKPLHFINNKNAHPRERVKPTRPPKAQHTLIIATSAATPDCLQGCRRDGGLQGNTWVKKVKESKRIERALRM
jgi:hypothetical protein